MYLYIGLGVTGLVLGALAWYYRTMAKANETIAKDIALQAQEIATVHKATVGRLNQALRALKSAQDAETEDDVSDSHKAVTASDAATFLNDSVRPPGSAGGSPGATVPAARRRRTRFIYGFARRASLHDSRAGRGPGFVVEG